MNRSGALRAAASPSSGPRATPAGITSTQDRGPWFLRPGLWLTDKFGTSSRLAILCAVLVIPGLATTWALDRQQSQQIRFTTTELTGLEVATPAIAQMSTAAAGGEVSLDAVVKQVGAHPDLKLGSALTQLQAALSTGDAVAHTAALRTFVSRVADASNLTLDSDLDSTYVLAGLTSSLPQALVAAAQASRPLGAGRTSYDRAAEAANLIAAGDALDRDVESALQSDPAGADVPRLDSLKTLGGAARTRATVLRSTLTDPSAVSMTQVTSAAAAAVNPVKGVLRTLLQQRKHRLVQDRALTLSLVAAADVLAIGFAAATWWRSRRDVSLTVAAVKAIARGDLEEHPVPTGRDELGDIARALSVARTTLVDQRAQLHNAQLDREEQLRVGFQHQREGERQTRERAQLLIDEAATTVLAELASVMEQVEAVRRTAGVLEERVVAAESVTRSVVEEAAAADRGALALGGSLREVGAMAAIIGGIAGQTKLLALNATIEAARAGAIGQGFTVVADEVKSLASSTAHSTERISETLTALESDAAQVGAAITSVGSGIASLEDATSALSGVATEQRGVVAQLQSVLTTTMGRVEQLTTLSDSLERRRADRRPLSGSVRLDAGGRVLTADLADLSATGMRCLLQAPVEIRPGTVLRASIEVRGQHLDIRGTVVRGVPGAEATDLGVEFIDATSEQRTWLTNLLNM